MEEMEKLDSRKEISAKAFVDKWARSVTQSNVSDKITESFVDTVMTIRKRVFSFPACLEKLQVADDKWGIRTPWDSVYKIEFLARKSGGSEDKMLYMLEFVADRYAAGYSDTGDFALRQLTGKGAPGGDAKSC